MSVRLELLKNLEFLLRPIRSSGHQRSIHHFPGQGVATVYGNTAVRPVFQSANCTAGTYYTREFLSICKAVWSVP